jgi:hypothetical protein
MRTIAARLRHRAIARAWLLLAVLGAPACGEGDHSHEDSEGSSGAVCPTTDAPTYENFGSGFMSAYCTRCHSAMATDRQGAPSDHNFDRLSEIRTFAGHVDERAAAGPNGVNTSMPPTDPKPSEEERRKLGAWLACEKAGRGGQGDGGGASDGGGGG